MAIFASGTGTNAAKIIEYFKHHAQIKVSIIVSNRSDAGVWQIAKDNHIPALLIRKEDFVDTKSLLQQFSILDIQLIVLAGFLWKIPATLIQAYPNKIINLHPALLPQYGGKGMYGMHVHEAVIHNQEKESGITIHFVDEKYDHGRIIFQAKCQITNDDTAQSLSAKIRVLEHQYFAPQIERLINSTSE